MCTTCCEYFPIFSNFFCIKNNFIFFKKKNCNSHPITDMLGESNSELHSENGFRLKTVNCFAFVKAWFFRALLARQKLNF